MPDHPEPAAIAAVLAARPEVAGSAILAVPTPTGATALHVFVVPRGARPPDTIGDRPAAAGLIHLPDPGPAAAPIQTLQGESDELVSLTRLMGALAGRPGPIPKYRYPSAGTLYPVQAYLTVPPGAVDGLAPGAYYYDPDAHTLVRLSDEAITPPGGDGSDVLLLLVAQEAAIAPIYGAQARDFCLLEAGYMSEVLAQGAAGGGLRLDDLGEPIGLLGAMLAGPLHLDDSHMPLACWAVRPRTEAMLRAVLRRELAILGSTAPVHLHALEQLPLDGHGGIDEAALRGWVEGLRASELSEGACR